IAGETPTHTHARLPVRTTWEDLEEGTVYMDIECEIPPVRSPVQTPPSPEWFSESLPVSPAIPSLVATLAPTATLNEDALLEIGAQLELNGSILHTHTKRLDALPPNIFQGYGQDFIELFSTSAVIHEEILSQRTRLRSLERVQEENEITMDQREMQELREHITALERMMDG
ncbi:hypothetical protein Tco_0113900, partial [Tanacetum coccineum]